MVLRVVNTETINQISVEPDVYHKYKQKRPCRDGFRRKIRAKHVSTIKYIFGHVDQLNKTPTAESCG